MFFPLLKTVPGKQKKKVTWGKIGWIGRVGYRYKGHAIFDQKLLTTQPSVGGAHINHEMSECIERLQKKKMHWSRTQPLTATPALHWCRWVPRTLTYLGKPVLQGVRPPEDYSRVRFFWIPPRILKTRRITMNKANTNLKKIQDIHLKKKSSWGSRTNIDYFLVKTISWILTFRRSLLTEGVERSASGAGSVCRLLPPLSADRRWGPGGQRRNLSGAGSQSSAFLAQLSTCFWINKNITNRRSAFP